MLELEPVPIKLIRKALTVLVNNTVTAGNSSGDISICSSDNLTEQNLLDNLTDENAGGTWTDDGGATVTFPINTAGVYTYTVVGTGACADQTDSESLTVLVNNTVTAGTSSGDISICSSDNLTEQDLLDTLTDENAGGTWTDGGGATVTFPINTAGTYTYTVVGTGACAGQTDTAMVIIRIETCGSPFISLEKTAVFNDENNDGFPSVGETITYSFKAINTGSLTVTNISISDPLFNEIMCTLPRLVSGASELCSATYSITADDIVAGRVTNQARVIAQDPNGIILTDLSDDPNNNTNIDPNNDGDPDDPTIIEFNEIPFEIFNAISPDANGMNDFFKNHRN